MTCKDCIHYEVCLNFSDLGLGTLNEDECGMFKDKSRFTVDQNCSGIVRCKDCVHFQEYEVIEDFDGKCTARGGETDKDDFCNYGEKGRCDE